jgi:hypothetical protein
MVAVAAEKRVEESLSFVIVVLFDLVIDNIVKTGLIFLYHIKSARRAIFTTKHSN